MEIVFFIIATIGILYGLNGLVVIVTNKYKLLVDNDEDGYTKYETESKKKKKQYIIIIFISMIIIIYLLPQIFNSMN